VQLLRRLLATRAHVLLQEQVDARRGLLAVDGAMQAFRRHTTGCPVELDLSLFFEEDCELLGRGGAAKVCGR